MSIIIQSRFSTIDIPTNPGVSLQDIAVDITSDHRLADLELGANVYALKRTSGGVQIKPQARWLDGITVSVTIAGAPYKDTFRIPKNRGVYDPEQALYSLGKLSTVTHEDMINLAMITRQESEIIDSLGPKCLAALDALGAVLCSPFTYNGVTTPKLVTRAICFRRMQQLAFMLGMDSFVEAVLLTPGLNHERLRGTYISAARSDSAVLERLPGVSAQIDEIRNKITLSGLNADVVDSVDAQISPGSAYNLLAKTIAIMFCAMRYTYDNPKFRH
jgi:hypothetical protein